MRKEGLQTILFMEKHMFVHAGRWVPPERANLWVMQNPLEFCHRIPHFIQKPVQITSEFSPTLTYDAIIPEYPYSSHRPK